MENSEGYLTITGGTITVNAEGDGLDANTSITQTGGKVTVFGPVSRGNGALDYGDEYKMTGGTLLAVGSSGMAQSTSSTSTVPVISTDVSGLSAGSTLTVKDSSGKTIYSVKVAKDAENLVYASSELKSGSSYTIYSGSTKLTTVKAGKGTDSASGKGTKGPGANGQGASTGSSNDSSSGAPMGSES